MTLARYIVSATLCILCAAPAAIAQSGITATPAEVPPASYTGTEYVDSRGCVFARAGVNGTVTWAPRMRSAQEQVCGRTPTVIAGASLAPPPVPPADVTDLDPEATRSTVTAVGMRPAPDPASRATPARASSGDRIGAGRAIEVTKLHSAPPAPRVIVRRLGKPVPSAAFPGHTRVVPLHVAQKRARVGTFTVPRGYRAAWEDDRLNPHRAEGTLAGRDAMNQIWTTTVPRRLIDPSQGRDRAPKPAVVYPYVAEIQHVYPSAVMATRAGDDRTRQQDRDSPGSGR